MNAREKIKSLLKADELIFDPREMPTSAIRDMAARGFHPVCCRCGARLEYALSPSEAISKGVSPGVRCPRSLSHCQIVVEFAEGD